MLSEDEIINQFRKHGMTRGAGSLYLKVPTAFDFLAMCQENNLAIIGVEGFIYNPSCGVSKMVACKTGFQPVS
jgi:hypothetical protein